MFDPLPPLNFPFVVNLFITFSGLETSSQIVGSLQHLSGNKEATRKSCGRVACRMPHVHQCHPDSNQVHISRFKLWSKKGLYRVIWWERNGVECQLNSSLYVGK